MSRAMLTARSIYSQGSPGEGLRVLTTQYWPRGVSKEKVDRYLRCLGPSRQLLHGFKSGHLGWDEYRERYLMEMSAPTAREAIESLRQVLKNGEAVTIMCVCRDEDRCHRSLLRELILQVE